MSMNRKKIITQNKLRLQMFYFLMSRVFYLVHDRQERIFDYMIKIRCSKLSSNPNFCHSCWRLWSCNRWTSTSGPWREFRGKHKFLSKASFEEWIIVIAVVLVMAVMVMTDDGCYYVGWCGLKSCDGVGSRVCNNDFKH